MYQRMKNFLFSHFHRSAAQGAISTTLCNYNVNESTFGVIQKKEKKNSASQSQNGKSCAQTRGNKIPH
jgi:hypothetical protein